jgi:hypothetical protein
VNELIDDVSEYCAVSMGANLDITRDDGQNRIRTWELISTRQKHVRDAPHEVWEMDKAFDAFRDTHGLVAEQLVQVVEKRRLEKPQPTYAVIEQELGVPPKEAGKLAQIIRDLKKDFARRPALLALMKEGNYGAKDRPSTSFMAGSE